MLSHESVEDREVVGRDTNADDCGALASPAPGGYWCWEQVAGRHVILGLFGLNEFSKSGGAV